MSKLIIAVGLLATGAWAGFLGGSPNVAVPVVSLSSHTATRFPPSSVAFSRGFQVFVASDNAVAVWVSSASNVCNGVSCDTTSMGAVVPVGQPVVFDTNSDGALYFYIPNGSPIKLRGVAFK